MKALNLFNLYNAEITKSSLFNIRGGDDDKRCTCGHGSPAVAVSAQAPGGDMCVCGDPSVYNSTKHRSGDR
jgi:hypothetical protein